MLGGDQAQDKEIYRELIQTLWSSQTLDRQL